MSSDYMILCVSHDPVITFGNQWSTPEPAFAAIADRTQGPAQTHPNCDLLVGRYSYPLIEVACPPGGRHPGLIHTREQWIDVQWLRLLALSTPEQVEAAGFNRCWTRDIALRLRIELDLPATHGEQP